MLKIKVKKLAAEAILPTYARPGDAALDVFAITKTKTEKFVEYGTGLAFEVPPGHMMLVFPRGSISNKDLILANSVGVLDSGYRGELKLRFRQTGQDDYQIGERVGQILVLPLPEVEWEEVAELNNSQRGEGRFGSTGLN